MSNQIRVNDHARKLLELLNSNQAQERETLIAEANDLAELIYRETTPEEARHDRRH